MTKLEYIATLKNYKARHEILSKAIASANDPNPMGALDPIRKKLDEAFRLLEKDPDATLELFRSPEDMAGLLVFANESLFRYISDRLKREAVRVGMLNEDDQ